MPGAYYTFKKRNQGAKQQKQESGRMRRGRRRESQRKLEGEEAGHLENNEAGTIGSCRPSIFSIVHNSGHQRRFAQHPFCHRHRDACPPPKPHPLHLSLSTSNSQALELCVLCRHICGVCRGVRAPHKLLRVLAEHAPHVCLQARVCACGDDKGGWQCVETPRV